MDWITTTSLFSKEAAIDMDKQIKEKLVTFKTTFFDIITLLYTFDDVMGWSVIGYLSLKEYIDDVVGESYGERMKWHLIKVLRNKVLARYIAENRADADLIGHTKLRTLLDAEVITRNNIQKYIDIAKDAPTNTALKKILKEKQKDNPNAVDVEYMTLRFTTKDDYEFVKTTIEVLTRVTCEKNTGKIVVSAFQEVMSSHPEWFEAEEADIDSNSMQSM